MQRRIYISDRRYTYPMGDIGYQTRDIDIGRRIYILDGRYTY